ncbi:MAG TPA: hypothetical protein VIA45_05820, partial [Thermoanaerobaculia bacterium]
MAELGREARAGRQREVEEDDDRAAAGDRAELVGVALPPTATRSLSRSASLYAASGAAASLAFAETVRLRSWMGLPAKLV